MPSQTPLSLQETLDIAEGLLNGWKSGQPAKEFSPRKGVDHLQFACVYGLAAHAHRLAKATVVLYEANLILESLPTVRCVYEHGLTAMWVAQNLPAARALINEGYRNRKNTIESAKRAGWTEAVQLADDAEKYTPTPSPLDDIAKKIHKVCNELQPGGVEAYSIYRLMSMMAHPGAHLIDYYLHIDPIEVQTEPKKFDQSEVWMFMTCCSLVWSGRAVDMLHKEHSRRNELRAAAKKLGISPELRPRFR